MSTHQEGHVDHQEHPDHHEHGHHEHHEHSHDMHAGHDHHGHGGHGDHVAQFRRLFWIMLVLAIPGVGLSPVFADLLGYSLPDVPGLAWVAPLLGTVMYVWGGKPFLTGGLSELRSRTPGMMLLISLGITVAFLASWGSRLGLLDRELEFWWELALLIVIMLLGHWIEMRSPASSASSPRRSPPPPAPGGSRTAPPPGCSGSRSVPPCSPRSSGRCWACPRTPSSAP